MISFAQTLLMKINSKSDMEVVKQHIVISFTYFGQALSRHKDIDEVICCCFVEGESRVHISKSDVPCWPTFALFPPFPKWKLWRCFNREVMGKCSNTESGPLVCNLTHRKLSKTVKPIIHKVLHMPPFEGLILKIYLLFINQFCW